MLFTHRFAQRSAAVALMVLAALTSTACAADDVATSGVVSAPVAPAVHTWVVNNRAVNTDDGNPGTEAAPFKTISKAAAVAQPGDTILVHAGVYRERVAPARGGVKGKPITYEAARGERVVVKGSDRWMPAWEAVKGHPGVYRATLDAKQLGLEHFNPYHIGIHIAAPAVPTIVARPVRAYNDAARQWLKHEPSGSLPRTLGQLFVDGQPLTQTLSLNAVYLTPNTWIVTPDGAALLAHFPATSQPPSQHLVELTVRERIFAPHRRGLGYITVRGFIFEHCANQGPFPQIGAVDVRSGNHWIIEHNTIRYAKTVGLACGSESWKSDNIPDTVEADRHIIIGGDHLIRNNAIIDNGLTGISGWNSRNVRIIGNRIERNNRLGFMHGYDAQWPECAGIKMHAFINGVIAGNLIRNNDAYGIWLDNAWRGARISRNVILNNLGAGVFFELGNGPGMLDNNVIGYTQTMNGYSGYGVYTHDASGVTVAHNLILNNANYGVLMRVITNRKVGKKILVEASHERVLNNIFSWNLAAVSLPFPSRRGRDNISDGNLVLRSRLADRNTALFEINTNTGRIKRQTILNAFHKALPKGQWCAPSWWNHGVPVTLDQWRAVTRWGKHSAMAKDGKTYLRPSTLQLQLDLPPGTLKQVTCSPVPGITHGYLGQPMPAHPLPGPFQQIPKNGISLILWAADFASIPIGPGVPAGQVTKKP